jgi:hypothetical protein
MCNKSHLIRILSIFQSMISDKKITDVDAFLKNIKKGLRNYRWCWSYTCLLDAISVICVPYVTVYSGCVYYIPDASITMLENEIREYSHIDTYTIMNC